MTQFGYFIGGRPVRVVPPAFHPLHHLLDFVFAVESRFLFQKDDFVGVTPLGDDRNDGLTRHVATEDENLRLIELGCMNKLFPADFRSVNIGGKEKSGHDWFVFAPLRRAHSFRLRRPSPFNF